MHFEHEITYIVLTAGVLIFLSLVVKNALSRAGFPPLAGWILLGVLCRVCVDRAGFFDEQFREVFEFLADIGVITLLFKIGLESKLGTLLSQLRKASYLWAGNMIVSGVFGYAAAHFLLGMSPLLSFIIGIAMTATSVGVSVNTWDDAGRLDTPTGGLLVDLAEMDDISGIMLM